LFSFVIPKLPLLGKHLSNFSSLNHLVLLGALAVMSCVSASGNVSRDQLESPINTPNIYVVSDVSKTDVACTNGLGCWIWAKQVLNKQTIYLWKTFQVSQPYPVVHAKLSISADNAYTVWLDGQEIGSGSDWRSLNIYELRGKLNPGIHVLAVEGFNDTDKAGVIVGLSLKLANGQFLQVRSDTSWRVVPKPVSGWQTVTQPPDDWPKARFIAVMGQNFWWHLPITVAHIQGLLPEPIPFWQTRKFQSSLFVGCGFFIIIGLYLLIQLVSQSNTHNSLRIERDRIARDLHDDLGSKVNQLLLTGEAALIKHTEPDAAIPKICESARDILATIDDVVWIVNSQHDKLNDFAIQICKHTQRFLESTNIRYRFDVGYEFPPKTITQLARRNLFLVVKEAVNNAVKHSHATELTVRIQLEGSMLIVTVEDNGIGFDSKRFDNDRNGLANMTRRMEEIGGSAQIITRPGHGSKICLKVSLTPSRFQRFLFKRLFQRKHQRNENSGVPVERMTYADKV
jgi:signal transduction histidine kinase